MKIRSGLQQICAIAALAALLAMQTAQAQQPTGSSSATVPARAALTAANAAPAKTIQPADARGEEQEAVPARRPGGEGIKVHGHWVLELKNPDGKLVDRREFDNSLVQNGAAVSGPQLLVLLLTGDMSAAGMGVALIQGPTTAPGSDPSEYCYFAVPPAGISCYMLYNSLLPIYPNQGSGTNTWQGGLTQTATFGPNAFGNAAGPNVNIVLAGNYVVPAGLTTINAVSTYEAVCGNPALGYAGGSVSNFSSGPSTVSPSACTNPSFIFNQPNSQAVWIAAFTNTNVSSNNVPAPLLVSPGQVIAVTVTLSFA
jgi:hypothetical protein